MSDVPYSDGSDATSEPAAVERDPDDELIIDPDDDVAIPMPAATETVAPDADRALHEAGGDGDRAEDLLEDERAQEPSAADVPDAERLV